MGVVAAVAICVATRVEPEAGFEEGTSCSYQPLFAAYAYLAKSSLTPISPPFLLPYLCVYFSHCENDVLLQSLFSGC